MKLLKFAIFAFVLLNINYAYSTGTYTRLYSFSGSFGNTPYAGQFVRSGSTLYGMTTTDGTNSKGVIYKINIDGTGYTEIHSFDGTNGKNPNGTLTLDGTTLYGMTSSGGAFTFYGVIFKIQTDGSDYTVLHSFNSTNGGIPRGNLLLSGSTLYGTTNSGGTGLEGVVFKINTDGTAYTVLRDLTSATDGQFPYGDLILSGSTLYGTTTVGGTNDMGTIFKVNTDGTNFSVIRHFAGQPSDGNGSYRALLLNGTTLYGTTYNGGANDMGTVFKIQTDGSGFTLMHSFSDNPDGKNPYCALVLVGSTLWGTTRFGGDYFNTGGIFNIETDGSGYSFRPYQINESYYTMSTLLFYNNVFYGFSNSGGANSVGSVFSYAPFFLPTVTTTSITNIDLHTATGGGNVTDEGSAAVTARGVCWSTSSTPTIADDNTSDGTGTGSFVSSLTGLTSNSVYYVRAYATNSGGTAYGNQVSFTTVPTLPEWGLIALISLSAVIGGFWVFKRFV